MSANFYNSLILNTLSTQMTYSDKHKSKPAADDLHRINTSNKIQTYWLVEGFYSPHPLSKPTHVDFIHNNNIAQDTVWSFFVDQTELLCDEIWPAPLLNPQRLVKVVSQIGCVAEITLA